MTREEAIKEIKTLKEKVLNVQCEKYLDEAIKALEQEPVLDKIRAEIADLADADAYGDYQQGFSFGLMRAVQIIDKYKAESEE